MKFKQLDDKELEQFWYFANANNKIDKSVFQALNDEVDRRGLTFRRSPYASLIVNGDRMDWCSGITYESNDIQSMTLTEQLQLIAEKTPDLSIKWAIEAVIDGNLDESHIAALDGLRLTAQKLPFPCPST